jgi:hypothetical protein
MTRTYGTLTHQDEATAGGKIHGLWQITAEPHVMIRLKRIFPRVQWTRTGEITVDDTPDVARDLEWITQRWPLAADRATAVRLRRRVAEHRRSERVLRSILDGTHQLPHERRPAREPYWYQQQAADVVLATGRLPLLTDPLGSGKTQTALTALAELRTLPALVVTLAGYMPQQWLEQLAIIWPDLRGHILVSTIPYELRSARGMHGADPDVIITSYSKLAGWADHLAGHVNYVIFDEAQELRTGAGTRKGAAAAHITSKARYVMGVTNTPVYNYGDEVHNILDILVPSALGSREEFIREWGGMHTNNGKVLVADPAALGTYLRDQGLMVGRSWTELGIDHTEPTRIAHAVDADHAVLDDVAGDTAEMARLILSTSSTPQQRFRAAGELDLHLRHATGVAKAPYVAEFVRLLLEAEQRIVLWGWHRAVYDIWLERLAEFHPVLYTGTESPRQKAMSVAAFKGGFSRVLMMSLRAGAGIDGLQEACHVGVFGELDWSPKILDQCIGRLDRDGKCGPVIAYILHSEYGSDPTMAEVLQIKRQQSEPIVNPQVELFTPIADDGHDRIRRLAAAVLDQTKTRKRDDSDAA